MPRVEIISEIPITMGKVNELLSEVKKRDEELTPRAIKTFEYVSNLKKKKENKDLKKELENLGITRLRDRHIVKLIDLSPKNIEELKLILTGENITLKQEDMEKLVATIK